MELSIRTLASTALLIVVLFSSVLSAGAVAAQDNTTNATDKAPYYNNSSTAVANESWTEGHEEPTLANFTHYLTRVGGFVIGDGGSAQGGGSANSMIVGLLFMGAFGAVAVGGRFGSVGGVVMGTAAIGGLATASIIPTWLYPVVLFAVGGIASIVAIRTFR